MRRSITVAGLEHGSNPIPAACRIGPLLTTGGVRGVDRATGQLPSDPADEVRLAFANLSTLLEAGGAGLGDVAHVTVFVADKEVRPLLNTAWVEAFPDPDSRPARHVLAHDLPGGMRIQLEATAYIEGEIR
ncbi:RidA family protein [Granulicoccus phenolivorans]|uniref:RidA family protein n=1 Tax=Granulicoccus phenolivorans TaxID=266854 RepID=UPI0003FF96BE|nr:Rid family hydrolase [Granulicoccus phenolivorans]